MQTEKTGVVYRIYHKASMKSYIGKSVRPDRRIHKHLNGKSSSPVLRNAVKKYGAETFRVEFLESDVPESVLSKLEILHIRFFNSKAPNGYNLTDGGEGRSGAQISQGTRSKMRARTPWNKGKTSPYSDETRQKMSAAHKGKKLSPETRRKISEANKGRTSGMKGKKLSPEARRKVSEAQKGRKIPPDVLQKRIGRKHTPETRRKISEAHKGMTHTPETRQKISEANKGKKLSPEARRKVSEANKGRTSGMKGKTPWNKGKSPSPETRRKISESLKRRNRSS